MVKEKFSLIGFYWLYEILQHMLTIIDILPFEPLLLQPKVTLDSAIMTSNSKSLVGKVSLNIVTIWCQKSPYDMTENTNSDYRETLVIIEIKEAF